MPSTLRLTAVAIAAATTVLLAGCGAPAPAEPTTTTTPAPTTSETTETTEPTTPAAGTTVTGDGYSYVVPEGWEEITGAAAGLDTAAADSGDDDGFSDNVNVVISPAGLLTPDQVESLITDELSSGGATDIMVLDRITVAGAETPHVQASLDAGGSSYVVEQYYVSNDTQTYVVTFSFSPERPEADRVAFAESVLATWTFA